MWKGDNPIHTTSLHEWIKNHKPKPKFCEICKKNKPYDLANISGEYKRDINDFRWLCRSCHMKKDGRLKKLHNNKKKTIKEKCKSCGRLEKYNIKGYCPKCYRQAYIQKNKEEINRKNKEYYQRNKEEINRKGRECYQKKK